MSLRHDPRTTGDQTQTSNSGGFSIGASAKHLFSSITGTKKASIGQEHDDVPSNNSVHGRDSASNSHSAKKAVSKVAISEVTDPYEQILRGSEFPSEVEEFEIGKVLGKGAFGVVKEAKCKKLNMSVALKIMNIDLEKWKGFESMFVELEVLRNLRHEYIVSHLTSFIADFYDDEEKEEYPAVYIVFPLLDGYSLGDMMRGYHSTVKLRNGIKDSASVATILRKVLRALEYMHGNGVIHRDIKGDNVMVTRQGKVYMIDFGVAKQEDPLSRKMNPSPTSPTKHEKKLPKHHSALSEKDKVHHENFRDSAAGTPCWMAPEMLDSKNRDKITNKADIWSLGILALELAYGEPPHYKLKEAEIKKKIIEDAPPTGEHCYRDESYIFPKQFHQFVAACLQKDPTKRPTATELLNHAFIKKGKSGKNLHKVIFG